MKIRNKSGDTPDEIKLEMTPMIDIVFQLLVFFIMTFKIVDAEGDFNIKMPLSAPSEGLPEDDEFPPMKLRLTAGANGELTGIQLNDNTFRNMTELNRYIISVLGDAGGSNSSRENAEVEIDCDYNLRYRYVVEAVTAVSGTVVQDDIVKLVEKIKFAAPRPPG